MRSPRVIELLLPALFAALLASQPALAQRDTGVAPAAAAETRTLEPAQVAIAPASIAQTRPTSFARDLQQLAAGEVFRDCADCPEMVLVPGGSFLMGSPSSEAGRDRDEGPVHRVSLPRHFAIGRTEVTVGEFRKFVQATGYRTDAERNVRARGCKAWDASDGIWDWRADRHWDNPAFAQGENHPVACVSWNDARAYLEWLSSRTGRSYRLPSEAQWEYAARAGSTASRSWGDNPHEACRYANVTDRSFGPGGRRWRPPVHDCVDGWFFSAAAASGEANAFGLHDMLGNVWEWTEDCWNESYRGAPADGSAWSSGDCRLRVARGGSWLNSPRYVRSAKRNGSSAHSRVDFTGFRAARVD